MKRHLGCSCCGGDAGRWLQWWNQDTGFGICVRCVDWRRSRGTDAATILDYYGKRGVHWGNPGDVAEQGESDR